MSPSVRVRFAFLLLAFPAGACFSGGSPPPQAECDSPDPARVDSIELDARSAYGGQGARMLLFDVTFHGPELPSCAEVEWEVASAETGERQGGGVVYIETVPEGTGVKTREPRWEIWDDWIWDEVLDLTVTTYGQTARARVYQPSDDAGVDAAADPDDAAVPPDDAAADPDDAAVPPDDAAVPPDDAAVPPEDAGP